MVQVPDSKANPRENSTAMNVATANRWFRDRSFAGKNHSKSSSTGRK